MGPKALLPKHESACPICECKGLLNEAADISLEPTLLLMSTAEAAVSIHILKICEPVGPYLSIIDPAPLDGIDPLLQAVVQACELGHRVESWLPILLVDR